MFKKLISEARDLVEGAGMPGKLSKKYDRGSRGADSFRSFTKKQTNRARRRAEKSMLADTPRRQTKGYSHATWPANPVYTQKLYDKPKAEAVMDEGGGSRLRKPARQAALMKRQGFEATPARGLGDPDKKAAARDMNSVQTDPLAKRAQSHPDDPHTQLKNKLFLKKNPPHKWDPMHKDYSGPNKHPTAIWKKMQSEDDQTPAAPESFTVHFKDGRKVAGPFKSKQRARTAVDRLDNKHGGYAHHIRDGAGKTRI